MAVLARPLWPIAPSANPSNGRSRDSRGTATVDRLGRAYFFFFPLRKGQKTLSCASILAPIRGSLSNFGPVMLRKSPSVLIGAEAYCSRLTRASQPAILALQTPTAPGMPPTRTATSITHRCSERPRGWRETSGSSASFFGRTGCNPHRRRELAAALASRAGRG